jgi:hypothetical protein
LGLAIATGPDYISVMRHPQELSVKNADGTETGCNFNATMNWSIGPYTYGLGNRTPSGQRPVVYAAGMGLWDALLGRRPGKRPAVPMAPAYTVKRFDGTVEVHAAAPQTDTFEAWVARNSPVPSKPRDRSNYSPRPKPQNTIDPSMLNTLDLRAVKSMRMRIKGTYAWISENQRSTYGGTEYLLVREPENTHDERAVAIYGKGRKVGYLSASKAEGIAYLLDHMPADAFLVSGATTTADSSQLWVDVPSAPALRVFAKAHQK